MALAQAVKPADGTENTAGFLKEYTTPQPAAQKNTAMTFIFTLVKLTVTLAIVVALIYATVFVLKMVAARYGMTSAVSIGGIESVDSLVLGQHRALHLVRVYNKRLLLLAVSDKETQVLDKIEDEQAVSEILAQIKQKWESAKTFKEHFQDARQKRTVQANISGYIRDLQQKFMNPK